MPKLAGCGLGKVGLKGKIWTALRMKELISVRHEATVAFLAEMDHVVAVCQWVYDLLVDLGVRAEKISLIRQGLPHPVASNPRVPVAGAGAAFRLAFLGRCDRFKGIDLLIDALSSEPELPVELDIYAVLQSQSDRQSLHELRLKTVADGRIRFLPVLQPDEVIRRLSRYDALAVPSQWLETGPLVVYEAFAAGIPVVGSALGGIAELVQDGENGLLVDGRTAADWARVLRRLTQQPDILSRLKSHPKAVRTMDTVAHEMSNVYLRFIKPHHYMAC
jgi:glycosyltransferase involved in cell wall biosynthesis